MKMPTPIRPILKAKVYAKEQDTGLRIETADGRPIINTTLRFAEALALRDALIQHIPLRKVPFGASFSPERWKKPKPDPKMKLPGRVPMTPRERWLRTAEKPAAQKIMTALEADPRTWLREEDIAALTGLRVIYARSLARALAEKGELESRAIPRPPGARGVPRKEWALKSCVDRRQ